MSPKCSHSKNHYEDWPDGGVIEICDLCAMSRYHSEQDTTGWIMVENIPEARKEIHESINRIMRGSDEGN